MRFGTIDSVGIGVGVVGIVAAAAAMWWNWYQARRTSRSRLSLHLTHRYSFDPATYDAELARVLSIQFAGHPVDNLICLHLGVRLDGHSDHDDPSARTPPGSGSTAAAQNRLPQPEDSGNRNNQQRP